MVLPLFCLLLGAFAIGTTELVVAGLLPPIAADLGVSISEAGLLVGGYAIAVAIGGPALMVIAAKFPRKPGIIGVLGLFLVAHLICAAAPTFTLLMVGRMIAAAAHGVFFGLAIALATGSVPEHRRTTALSVVVGGISIANIIGVPIGTAVGNAFGWRASFVMIAGFTVIAMIAVALFVPDVRATTKRAPLMAQVRVLANRMVLTAYALIVLQMIAVFSLITFIAPYMAEAAGVSQERLPLILLAIGLVGTIGTATGGPLCDRFPRLSLGIAYPLAASCLALGWLLMPLSWVAGVGLIALYSMVGSVASLSAQSRILRGARGATELASTLMSSVFNVGIAAGAGIGALAISTGLPFAHVPLIGVVALVPASLLALMLAFGPRAAKEYA